MMRFSSRRVLRSLAFKTIAPVIFMALVSWVGLFLFVIRSISNIASSGTHGTIADHAVHADFVRNVQIAFIITAVILLGATLLFIYSLRKNIRGPLDKILAPVRHGLPPGYHGITEFELLSDSIRTAMDLWERENRMLNNVYHIAAIKRGRDFFDEVVMAISRLFAMHPMISKPNPDHRSEHIVSMYINGEFRRGFDIDLTGTPNETVLSKKHIFIIEAGLREQFPQNREFAETKAEAFIGFSIFNSRGEAIGIVSAFGPKREFTESDIKVLQTIGQLVASEIERMDEEREKEEILEQLHQSVKMEAIGTLAGGIAHDFNNMLQGILGHATLLKAQISPGTRIYESADTIEHISERAAQLTRQLLGFARKGKYIVEPLLVNEIIDTVLKIISKTFDRKISIRTTLSNEPMVIEGDRSQIEQVIMNLCLNARDAMPEGGVLSIDTSLSPVAAGLHHEKSSDQAIIRISDTGIGIDKEVMKHIFEPFFTTKEIGKGTGMGLAMVYGVVRNHNGSISVESSEGRGTTFTVAFPAVNKYIALENSAPQEPVQGQGTILIVDDEEFIRNILKTMVEELGYRAFLADSGAEAVAIYSDQWEIIDLIILDFIMPDMNGKETFDRLRQISSKARVLVASGHATAEATGLSAGDTGYDFIQKPFRMHEIAEKIQSLLSV
jgi:signal transduction histidine kinase/CheY-like chemotaxis protein